MRSIFKFNKITMMYVNLVLLKNFPKFCFVNKVNLNKGMYNYISRSYFHSFCVLNKSADKSITDKSKTEGIPKPEKKKKEKLTYITLIESDEHVTVTTLEDASKLALRRNLKLIKVKEYDTKSERPTYQLLTTGQYLSEEKKSKSKFQKSNSSLKGTKLLSVSSKINDHDINAKIKNICRWLEKRYEVRIVISNDNGEAENVFDKIAEGVKEVGKLVQKRAKGMDVRFQIIPITKQTNETDLSIVESK